MFAYTTSTAYVATVWTYSKTAYSSTYSSVTYHVEESGKYAEGSSSGSTFSSSTVSISANSSGTTWKTGRTFSLISFQYVGVETNGTNSGFSDSQVNVFDVTRQVLVNSEYRTSFFSTDHPGTTGYTISSTYTTAGGTTHSYSSGVTYATSTTYAYSTYTVIIFSAPPTSTTFISYEFSGSTYYYRSYTYNVTATSTGSSSSTFTSTSTNSAQSTYSSSTGYTDTDTHTSSASTSFIANLSSTTSSQAVTTTKTYTENVRITTSRTSTRFNTSIFGSNSVLYSETVTNTTSRSTSMTTSNSDRIFTTSVTTSLRLNNAKYLTKTIVIAEAVPYTVTHALFTEFLGNEVLYIPTVSSTGFLQLSDNALSCDSTILGSTISSPLTLISAGTISMTMSTTLAGNGTSFKYTYSFIAETTASFLATYHSTKTTTASTTTTSATSDTKIPFGTPSTTTSSTGTIITFTTSRAGNSCLTYSTSGTFGEGSPILRTSLRVTEQTTTISSTLQMPGSYRSESNTITMVTTIISASTMTSFGGDTVHGENNEPVNFNTRARFTYPDRSVTITNSFFTSTGGIAVGTFTFTSSRSSTLSAFFSTHEEWGGGLLLEVDPVGIGKIIAHGGNPFNVNPVMAIGFRPATNDAYSAPIYFSPTFVFNTFSMYAWDKFTTTTTVGTDTTSTTDSSTISVAKTLATFPFSRISLHQLEYASIFVTSPFTESTTLARSYTSVWGSYKSFTTTTTVATTTTADPSTASTTDASASTYASPFVVTETTISLFSGNTIFITRSTPAVFLTNDGGLFYFSYDERYSPFVITNTTTETISINFGSSVTDSTHLMNRKPAGFIFEFDNANGSRTNVFDNLHPLAYGGYHPVTSQAGYALLNSPNDGWSTVGVALKMTIGPRTGGSPATSLTTFTYFTINENMTTGLQKIVDGHSAGVPVAQRLLTNNLSEIIAIEPLTLFSFINHSTDVSTVNFGFPVTQNIISFYSSSRRFLFLEDDFWNHV